MRSPWCCQWLLIVLRVRLIRCSIISDEINKKRGVKVCENTTAKLMSHAGIRSIRVGKFKVTTTDSKHNLAVADNILDRKFEAEKPNAVWVGDITYIHTKEGLLYLAGVMDLFSRRVVGWGDLSQGASSILQGF